MDDEGDEHLRNVLVMLAELHADDRCRAFENAMDYYNARHPDVRIEPNPAYTTRLVSEGPLERAIAKLSPA